MIGYSLCTSVGIYLNRRIYDKQSDGEKASVSLIMIGIWIFVGWLLYER